MTEKEYVSVLLSKIESKLNWGGAENWTQQDFDKLSELLEDKTNVKLSNTTLKRVWGRVQYIHSPSTTTLNILSQFLDFEDWRSFKQSLNVKQVDSSVLQKGTAFGRKWELIIFPGFGIFLIMGLLLILLLNGPKVINQEPINPSDFSFSANKILTVGVPNSVIFNYDASKSPSDSVFIIQTWDMNRKTPVPKTGKHHSAIYYYPGYFRTKLIVDSTIVKTHDLQIATDGWLALIEQDQKPIYIDRKDSKNGDIHGVDDTTISKYTLTDRGETAKLRFFNQRDLGNLKTDDFTFETKLRAGYDPVREPCPLVQILIQCKDDIIIVPLTLKNCVGEIYLTALGTGANSKYKDLSKFGTEIEQWTKLKITGQGQILQFFVNDNEAYKLEYPHSPAGIVGVQYRFPGAGYIKDAIFTGKSGRINLE